jgi:DNA-binding FadR family transcriptional regulator
MMTAITRTSLADQATSWLREKITTGQWRVGERIPPETELAEETGLGRNTIREAVKSLTYAGLLEIRHGQGTFVSSANELEAALSRRARSATARHVHEVRRGLETEAARLAAARRTGHDLARLRDAFAVRTAAADHGELAGYLAADLVFHQAVADAAHNPVLADIYASLAGKLACSVTATLHDRVATRRIDTWHEALLRAIEEGDAPAAARAASDYLSENLRVLGERDGLQ